MKTVLIVVFLLGVFACAQEVMEAGRDIPETDRDINEVEDAGWFHFNYSKSSQVPAAVNCDGKNITARIIRYFQVGKGDEKRLAMYVAEQIFTIMQSKCISTACRMKRNVIRPRDTTRYSLLAMVIPIRMATIGLSRRPWALTGEEAVT